MAQLRNDDRDAVAAWALLRRAHGRIDDRLDRELRDHCEITVRAYQVLAALPGGRATQIELAAQIGVSQSATSRLVDRLVDDGLVQRKRAAHDTRATKIELTEQGTRILHRAHGVASRILAEDFAPIFEGIGQPQFAAAMSTLAQPAELADSAPEPPATQYLGFGESLLGVRADATRVADAQHVREALEPLVALEAARYRTAGDIAECRALLDTMRASVESPIDYYRADWALHKRLAHIGPNLVLREIYCRLIDLLIDGVEEVVSQESDVPYVRERLHIHAELVAAVASGDPERVRHAAESHRFMGRAFNSAFGGDLLEDDSPAEAAPAVPRAADHPQPNRPETNHPAAAARGAAPEPRRVRRAPQQ